MKKEFLTFRMRFPPGACVISRMACLQAAAYRGEMRIDPYGNSFRDLASCYTTAGEKAKLEQSKSRHRSYGFVNCLRPAALKHADLVRFLPYKCRHVKIFGAPWWLRHNAIINWPRWIPRRRGCGNMRARCPAR